MEKMTKNMESMTVKKVVLKRVAMMMMMTMMLPVRKAMMNDAVWSVHPVMHDALCQCQDVKLLTGFPKVIKPQTCRFNNVSNMLCMARHCTTPRLNCTESNSLLHEGVSLVLLQK